MKKILTADRARPVRGKKKSANSPAKILPFDGSVARRHVRCGRANCKCKKGELHGPYLYVRVYWGGRRRWKYIRNGDVLALFQGREHRKANRQESRREQEQFRQQWRELKSLLRSLGL